MTNHADEGRQKMSDATQNPWAGEARERWGGTDAWKESERRSAKYGPAEWGRIKEEAENVEAGMAALLAAGASPSGPEAMALAEEARQHIGRWFYPCSHAFHVGLAEMYTADPRFREHYDQRAAGLAAFVADAIRANAARHGA